MFKYIQHIYKQSVCVCVCVFGVFLTHGFSFDDDVIATSQFAFY